MWWLFFPVNTVISFNLGLNILNVYDSTMTIVKQFFLNLYVGYKL